MTRQSTLIHAAELLEEAALAIYSTSIVLSGPNKGKWDSSGAKLLHREYIKSARALRELAAQRGEA